MAVFNPDDSPKPHYKYHSQVTNTSQWQLNFNLWEMYEFYIHSLALSTSLSSFENK